MSAHPEAVILVGESSRQTPGLAALTEDLVDAGFTVVSPPLPASDAASWTRTVEDAALAAAHHRRVHLVGFSLGGLLAILAARRSGASTLTTINAPVVLRDPVLAALPHSWRASVDPDAPTMGVASAADALRLGVAAHRTAPRLRRPTLVVQSKADDLVHPVSGRLLAHRLGPRARILWLVRSGHDPFAGPERDRLTAAVIDGLTRDELTRDGLRRAVK